MTVPTLSRAWYSRGNIPFPDTSTIALQNKSLTWLIKASLMNQISTGQIGAEGTRPSSSNWTCEYSCDGTTAGTAGDHVDRFTGAFDASKIVYANAGGTAHSWFVLKSPVTGWQNPIWMLIDCIGTAGTTEASRTTVLFSTTAFTGGSTTTAPTSTESWAACGIQDGYGMVGIYLGNRTVLANNFHFVCDANGMWFIATNLIGSTVLGVFDRLLMCVDAVEANTNDIRRCVTTIATANVASNYGGDTYRSISVGLGGRTWNNSGAKFKATDGAQYLHSGGGLVNWSFGSSISSAVTTISPAAVVHGYIASPSGYTLNTWGTGKHGSMASMGTAAADPSSGTFLALPAYMVDHNTDWITAWRGRIPDLYWVPLNISSFSYPNTGSPTMHVIGNVLIPLSVVPIT